MFAHMVEMRSPRQRRLARPPAPPCNSLATFVGSDSLSLQYRSHQLHNSRIPFFRQPPSFLLSRRSAVVVTACPCSWTSRATLIRKIIANQPRLQLPHGSCRFPAIRTGQDELLWPSLHDASDQGHLQVVDAGQRPRPKYTYRQLRNIRH